MDNYLSQDPSDRKELSHANEWFNEHGQPTFEQLKSLAEANTPEALEVLQQLADDYDITYDTTTDSMDLAEKVYAAMESDPNAGVE